MDRPHDPFEQALSRPGLTGFQQRMMMDIPETVLYDPRTDGPENPYHPGGDDDRGGNGDGRRKVKAPAMEWLTVLFGVEETHESVKQFSVTYDGDGRHLLVTPADRQFVIGEFTTPSLAELRLQSEASNPATSTTRIQISHITTEDVMDLHGRVENINAVFQVASQFNCLEFRDEYMIPEDGIWMYIQDQTQGPSCSIAAAPATFYRTYLAPVNGKVGQTRDNQINTFEDLSQVLKDPQTGEPYVKIKNGYSKASPRGLKRITEFIDAHPNRDEVMGLLRVGVHAGAQVTCIGRKWRSKKEMNVIQIDDKKQVVTQVLCSAVSCAYSQVPQRDWECLAKLVLDGTYEATLLAAAENARKTNCKKVYLTFIGGGAFGNSPAWISNAIVRALQRCRHLDLEVIIVHYRRIDPKMKAIIDSAL